MLEVEVEGRRVMMGDAVPIASGGPTARVSARADAPSPIRRRVLVHDGEDPVVMDGAGTEATLEAEVSAGTGGHCYVPAELADGEIVWASPVYFVAAERSRGWGGARQ